MASNVATLQAKLVADTSQFLSALKRAQGGLTGVGRGFKMLSVAAMPLKLVGSLLKSVAGGLLRIGQIAAGILLAELFRKAAQAVQWFIRTALDATETMQRLGIQIQTLSARELSKSIDASINQAVVWRTMSKEGELLMFNVQMLKDSVAEYGDKILEVNPELRNIINSNKEFAHVAVDVAKKWMSTSDVFDQSAGTASKFINQLKRIAIISPFTVATTNTMFRLASALGFTQKQSVTVTKGMLDVAAGLGLTEEAAQRLILNFSQIRSQGKLTQRDIREMSLTGFQMADVFDEMNRTLGTNIKTNLDFNDALKQSQFTWEEFVNAFSSMADREFGESAQRMAFTIGGLKSTFKDVFLTTIPEILMPTAELFGEFAQTAVENLLQLVESGDLEQIGEDLRTQVEIWLNHFSTFVLRLNESGFKTALEGLAQAGGLPPIVAESFRGLGQAIGTVEGLADIVNLLGQITSGSFDAFGRENLEGVGEGPMPVTNVPVADLIPDQAPLVAGIEGILEIWQKLRDWWDENEGPIVTAVTFVADIIGGALNGAAMVLGPSLDTLFVSIKQLIDSIDWEFWGRVLLVIATIVGGALMLAFMGLVGVINSVIGIVSRVIQAFAEMSTSVFAILDTFADMVSGKLDFTEGILQILGHVKDIINSAFLGIVEAGIAGLSGLFDGVASVFNGIAEFLGLESLPMLGETISEGFKAIFDNIVKFIQEKAGELHAIGAESINGLWEGMKSVFPRFHAWVNQQIAKIPQAIRDFLGIHSPSTVMIDIGTNIVSGLAAGIGSDDPGERLKRSFDLEESRNTLFTRLKAQSGGGGARQTTASGLSSIVSKITSATGLATVSAASAQVEAQAQSSAMLAQVQQSNTGQQIAAEAQTRTALASKLDEVIQALQAQGNASSTANAIVEGMQTADF